MGEIQQHAFTHTFNEAYKSYQKIGMDNLTMEELRTLLIGEYWMDGASWEVAHESGNAPENSEAIHDILRKCFDYQ